MQQPIECGTIVFRAMRKAWVDGITQRVLPAAFFRRPPPQDTVGLSVDADSPHSCALALRKCFGVASLHVGKLRSLGLEVMLDERPHANITGLPLIADDPALAERLASQLAKQARFIPPQVPQSPG